MEEIREIEKAINALETFWNDFELSVTPKIISSQHIPWNKLFVLVESLIKSKTLDRKVIRLGKN